MTGQAGQGVWDYILASANYTIAPNVEALVMFNGATGTGNSGDNVLSGAYDAAANTLAGGVGDDLYYVGGGDLVVESANAGIDTVSADISDIYVVDNVGDVVSEAANGGVWDYILASTNYTIAPNVEALVVFNGATGTGNAQVNHLSGAYDVNSYILNGQDGSDTYYGGRGGGADTLVETAADGDTDVLQFLAGVATNLLWFRQVGNDLEASIIGSADRVMMQGWYGGNGHAVEPFKTADGGKTLLESQVQGLVSAMAALSATPPATSSLPTGSNYDALRSMIATNWQ